MFTIARPKALAAGDAHMLICRMSPKTHTQILNLYADVIRQDMTISAYALEPETEPHLSVNIVGNVRSGIFAGQMIEFQISASSHFSPQDPYCGVLITTQPQPIFSVRIDPQRFAHIVTLIANKAVQELFIAFEKPRYRKANVLSWHVSTSVED